MEHPDVREEQAKERTLLAAERTYSAWMRTGLAAMAGGLAVARFVTARTSGHEIAAATIGTLLIVWAMAVIVFALWSYGRTIQTIQLSGMVAHSMWLYLLLTGVLLAVALLALWIVL
jgi:putative membrane protein